MNFEKLGLYVRTARHLEPQQLTARLVHVARARLQVALPHAFASAWRPGAPPNLALPGAPIIPGALLDPARRVAERWRAGWVRYLSVGAPRHDWTGERQPKLWRYERHYHSELPILAALANAEAGGPWLDEARQLISSWRDACPPPFGDAWEPYPVARRVLNWALSAYLAPPLRSAIGSTLSAQQRFLSLRLEYHLRGNHLICDACALIAAGAVLEGRDAAERGRAGERLLVRELTRQVLPDGGYAERTVQYHAIVLRDVLVALALARVSGVELDEQIAASAASMAEWLVCIARRHSVPLLNDAAPDAVPPVTDVLGLARAVGIIRGPWDSWLGRAFGGAEPDRGECKPRSGDVSLTATGWTIVRERDHELLFEHGPIGPNEQPGHGHSDALSYELIWSGCPVVTDSGVTTYEAGSIREFERSARAHATVTVGGEGPDELWAAFRVGARGRVRGSSTKRGSDGLRRLEGFIESPQGWRHRRRVLYWPGDALVVIDEVTEALGRQVLSRIPLDPDCVLRDGVIATPVGDLPLHVLRGGVRYVVSGATFPREGWVGEGFGQPRPRQSVAIEADNQGCVAYAIAAPGRIVVFEGGFCKIRGPGVAFEAAFDYE